MKVLFYKPDFAWPRVSGHDVHTFNIMKGLARQGAELSVITRRVASPEALEGLGLQVVETLTAPAEHQNGTAYTPMPWAQEKFRSYWGVPPEHVTRVADVATRTRADAVVVSGLDVLPLLGHVTGAARLWYAADEWCWHHMSQIRFGEPDNREHLRDGLTKLAYERAFASAVHRTWVVSRQDERAMRWLAGYSGVDVIANGVDTDFYAPSQTLPTRDSLVFWGRLDFGPNIQALEWFIANVWPLLRQARPAATLSVVGAKPTERTLRLLNLEGVQVHRDVPDVRPFVHASQIAVLPFVSGGGIKNKLLEALALGCPVVTTARVVDSLSQAPPVERADSARAWVDATCRLWDDDARRRALADEGRSWVMRWHSWDAASALAAKSLEAAVRSARL